MIGGSALIAAKSMHANSAKGGWIAPSFTTSADAKAAALQATQHATALLAAVRGSTPLTCRLATRALQNNWGNGHGMVAGPESIGAEGDAVFDWAVSDAIEPAVLPILRGGLADADMCVRRTAASLLGRSRGSDGIADDLAAELSNANARTREAALLAVGYAGKKADRAATERLLRDADPAVKLAAVWALGMIGDAAAVPALSALLRDGDPAMRANAAFALGNISSPAAIPSLVTLLGADADAGVRRAAAAALGRIDD
jgi:hypothetical protein